MSRCPGDSSQVLECEQAPPLDARVAPEQHKESEIAVGRCVSHYGAVHSPGHALRSQHGSRSDPRRFSGTLSVLDADARGRAHLLRTALLLRITGGPKQPTGTYSRGSELTSAITRKGLARDSTSRSWNAPGVSSAAHYGRAHVLLAASRSGSTRDQQTRANSPLKTRPSAMIA